MLEVDMIGWAIIFILLLTSSCKSKKPTGVDPDCNGHSVQCQTPGDCCTKNFKLYLKHNSTNTGWGCPFPPDNSSSPSYNIDVNVKVADYSSGTGSGYTYMDLFHYTIANTSIQFANGVPYITFVVPMKADMEIDVKFTDPSIESCCSSCGCGINKVHPVWNWSETFFSNNTKSFTEYDAVFPENPSSCEE
jgi:hypothetical protein